MLQELRDAGIAAHGADLTSTLRQGKGPRLNPGPPGPGTLIVHVNAPMIPWALWALGRRAVAQKRVVGYWAWELPKVPREWDIGYGFVHEIWTPSVFCARALRRPGAPPVSVMPHRVTTVTLLTRPPAPWLGGRCLCRSLHVRLRLVH
jgi:hypothetical protein